MFGGGQQKNCDLYPVNIVLSRSVVIKLQCFSCRRRNHPSVGCVMSEPMPRSPGTFSKSCFRDLVIALSLAKLPALAVAVFETQLCGNNMLVHMSA